MNTSKHLRNVLFKQIDLLSNHVSLFVNNPAADFSRNRKFSFCSLIKMTISMESGALKDELFKFFGMNLDTPTASALIQARDKIKVDAFKTLFHSFNTKTYSKKLFNGYRLIAVDGSELPINNYFADENTTVIQHSATNKPYSAFHLNASFDLLECTYDDLIIQGEAKKDENGAFCQLVDRYNGPKAIFIADRNYESYNGFEHVVKSGNKYLIRVKDIDSKTSLLRSLGPFPDDEFDIDVFRMLTLKNTKMIKACPQLYKFCPKNMHFDYMTKENPWYEFNCRIVRFKISEEAYECIVTNLDRDEFSPEVIKELYHRRWGIETSFREVKYALGLNALHSKKRNLIQQEIYARLLLHNFSQRIVADAKIPKRERKYQYQVNFTRCFHIIREVLKKKKTSGDPPVEDLIVKELLPIRPGRSYSRHVRSKSAVWFNYRFD